MHLEDDCNCLAQRDNFDHHHLITIIHTYTADESVGTFSLGAGFGRDSHENHVMSNGKDSAASTRNASTDGK